MKFDNLTDKSKLSDLCAKIGPIKYIYDCGSFDGLDGLHLCSLLNPLELHIFECNPPSYELILRNIELFGNKAIKIVPNKIGLSNVTGEDIFFPIDVEKTISPHKNGNPGASSFYKADASYRAEKYFQDQLLVKTIRLDDYVKNILA